MQEVELNNLEEFIPTLANGALKRAYLDTLAKGDSVLVAIDDGIYEVFANGVKKKIKDIKPPIKINISKKMTL